MIISLLEQGLIALPLLIGAYFVLTLLKLPDFSLESAYLFGAVIAFLAKDLPLPLILIHSILGGTIVGLTVSLINQMLNFPFLLAAIVTNGLFHGLTQYLLGSSVKSLRIDFPFQELTFLLILAGLIIASAFYILHSQLGYSFAIYGNNPLFFQNHHLSGRYVVIVGVMIGHGLAGLGGFLFAQSNGFVDLTMNFGVVLFCLTSLIIGRTLVKTHLPHLLIPLLGLVVYLILQQLLLRIGLNLKYFNSFQALCVLLILFIGKKQFLKLDLLGV